MQRKSTIQSRGANAAEKKFHAWVKFQPCSFCKSFTGSDVDHCVGSSYKHNKRFIGHLFVNAKCKVCHHIASSGNRKSLFKVYNKTDSDATLKLFKAYRDYTMECNLDGEIVKEGVEFDPEDLAAIKDVYAINEDITDWESLL